MQRQTDMLDMLVNLEHVLYQGDIVERRNPPHGKFSH